MVSAWGSIVFLLLLLPAGQAFAQIRVERLSLVDSSRAEMCTGIPNRLRIVGLQAGDRISLGNATVTRMGADLDIIQLQHTNPGTDTLKVTRKGHLLFAEPYRIVHLPDPELFLGEANLSGRTEIRPQELTVAQGLNYRAGNFRSAVSVDSFELSVVFAGEYIALGGANGPRFTGAQQAQLARLQPGDRIYIDNIKGTFSGDNRQRRMSPATMLISR